MQTDEEFEKLLVSYIRQSYDTYFTLFSQKNFSSIIYGVVIEVLVRLHDKESTFISGGKTNPANLLARAKEILTSAQC